MSDPIIERFSDEVPKRDPTTARFDEAGRFLGHEPNECGEDQHRTVGSHRAWCLGCSEWCYPLMPCRGCEIISVREQRDRAVRQLAIVWLHRYDPDHDDWWPTGHLLAEAWARQILDG